MPARRSFFIAFLFLSLTACTDQPDTAQSADAADGAIQEETTATGEDFSTTNVCELLPADLVANAVGGSVLQPARRSDYGTSQGCEYEVDPAGEDTYEYGAIWLGPPSGYGVPEDRIATDRGLGQEVKWETIEGLGDEAYVIHNATEEQSTVYVLLKDRMYYEVTMEHYEDARKLTDLVLTKF